MYTCFKIATPARYATTIVFIRLAVSMLQRRGTLQTAKEVGYRSRIAIEKAADRYQIRRNRRKNASNTNGTSRKSSTKH